MSKPSLQQEAIINNEDSVVRIVAGPGSGKTTTIVAMIGDRIVKGMPPSEITAFCFAKRDKIALREKIGKRVHESGHDANLVNINNFHGFSFSILRTFGFEDVPGSKISVVPDSTQRKFFREFLKGKGNIPNLDKGDYSDLLDAVSTLVDSVRESLGIMLRDVTDESIGTWFDSAKIKVVKECGASKEVSALLTSKLIIDVCTKYNEFIGNDHVDFAEMQVRCLHLLKTSTSVREAVNRQTRLIVVDEFQDVSNVQYSIIKQIFLLEAGKRLVVVGDVDQCVYSWRSANPQLMLKQMEVDYGNVTTLPLSTNYRSTPQIVAATNSLILNNIDRIENTMASSRASGAQVSMFVAKDSRTQAVEIVKTVKSIAQNHTHGEPSVAIICRSVKSRSSNEIQAALVSLRIPFTVTGGAGTVQKMYQKITSMISLVVNTDSKLALADLLEIVPGIGKKTSETILSGGKVPARAVELVEKLLRHVRAIRTISEEGRVIGEIGLLDGEVGEWFKEYYADNKNAFNSVKSSINFNVRETLEDFYQSLTTNLGVMESDVNVPVAIMTAHKAKGGEWKCVVMPDLCEVRGGFNHDAMNEEERRVAYVAATRAMDRLYLYRYTEGYKYTNYGIEKELVKESRFCKELLTPSNAAKKTIIRR